MSTRRTRPSRLAAWLLAAVLPPTVEGRSMLGDLLEEYDRRPGGLRRRVWFWTATVDLAVRYVPTRILGTAEGVMGDLVYAGRVARRTPGLSLAILFTLSLAIGASTAAFSVANGSWLRPLLSADRSVVVTWRLRDNGANKLWPPAELLALRGRTQRRTIEGATLQTLPVGTARSGQAETRVMFVTGTYLEAFRAHIARGRLLSAADERPGAAPVAVIDHLYWRRQMGGDPDVLGRTIWIRDVPFVVVGITGRDFVDPGFEGPSAWAPLSAFPSGASDSASAGGLPSLLMIGRLQSGATLREADEELTGLLKSVTGLSGGAPTATGAESNPVAGAEVVAALRLSVLGGLVLVILVLVLVCANVSNLQLAGAAARSREIAIRRSCGASRWRVVRQFATETATVSIASGVLGFLVARLAAPVVAIGMGLPGADVDLDLRTFVFALVLTFFAAVGTGLAPALQASGDDLSSSLKESARDGGAAARSRRTKSVFLGVQAAVSIVIVSLSALLVRSVVHIAWIGPGYDVDRLLNVSVPFPNNEAGRARAADFWRNALERVRSMPGVEAASLAFAPPFGISVGDPEQVVSNFTDEAYFATTGTRLLSGRTYTAAEVASQASVAVVSEEIARRFWPGENPVGSSAARIDANRARYEVIGVAADAMALRVHVRGAATLYVPGVRPERVQMTVRVADPQAMVVPVRNAVAAVAAEEAQPNVLIVSERFDRQLVAPRRYAGLAIAVALLTLALSVVGLSGVTMFAVQARTHEIGVRLALGARKGEVTALLLRDGLRAVVIGLAVGLVGAWMAGRYISSLLYGMSAYDPLAWTGAVAVLLGAAFAAVFLPTRRAAALDPAAVLREG